MHLELGARYDDREQEANPDKTFDQSVIPEDPALREDSWSVFTGSIGANYHVNDNLSVVANVGRGFRAPELFELFVNGVHGGVAAFQRGDPTLDEETSLNTDFGVRWRSERLEFKANVYRNAINDYIFLSGTGESNAGGLPIFQVDQDDARLIGADATLNARITDALSIRATGEIVDGEFDDAVNGEDELPLMPADKASLEGRYDLGRSGLSRGCTSPPACATPPTRIPPACASRSGSSTISRSARPRPTTTRCSTWAWASTSNTRPDRPSSSISAWRTSPTSPIAISSILTRAMR